MNSSSTRYLPPYQDAIVSYSLRLPTYRSSYIRRYHPYARYTTPVVQEQFMDEIDHDEPLLDLSILDRRVDPVSVNPTTIDTNQRPDLPEHTGEEQPHEPPVPMAVADVMIIGTGEQEGRPDENMVFIRVDIAPSS